MSKNKEQIKRCTTFTSPNGDIIEGAQHVHIKDWDYVQEHNKFVTAVPDMEPFCGKDATIVDIVAGAMTEELPTIYSIFEDGGKYWWSSEWLENQEE